MGKVTVKTILAKATRPGTYRITCREDSFIKAVANGHSAVFPSCECEIKNGTADFFKEGQWVWSCNAAYATAHFDLHQID